MRDSFKSGKYILVFVLILVQLLVFVQNVCNFNMITNGEQRDRQVLAILPDGSTGAPCGACRELMVQLMPNSYKDIEIMLDYENEKSSSAATLLGMVDINTTLSALQLSVLRRG